MGISGPSGALNNDPPEIQENEKVVDVERKYVDASAILPTKAEIYNTSHNKTALSETRNIEVINKLKGFIEGTPIIVTWFHIISSRGDNNTSFTELSFLSDSVNTSFLQINDMEVKLRAPMEFSYDTDNNVSTVVGECLAYPGFQPNIGDMFVYPLEAGVLGIFKVSDTPERLSIRVRTSHAIKFSLIKILTTIEYSALEERVRSIAYFDKDRFLNEDGALLTHQEKVDLDYIGKNIEVLSSHYGRKFYDRASDSIFRPDGVYDPYIVKFIHSVMGPVIDGNFINQLYTRESDYGWSRTIFAKLLTRDNITNILNTATIMTVKYSSADSIINALINKDMLLLDLEGDVSHVSDTILSLDPASLSELDRVILLLLEYGVVSYEILKDLVDNVRGKDDMTQFYHVPILICLLKYILNALKTGESIEYALKDINPYINIPFTSDDITDGVLSVNMNSKIIGLLTDNGVPLYINSTDITVIDGVTNINITPILNEYAIDVVTGTWNIVTNNPLIS